MAGVTIVSGSRHRAWCLGIFSPMIVFLQLPVLVHSGDIEKEAGQLAKKLMAAGGSGRIPSSLLSKEEQVRERLRRELQADEETLNRHKLYHKWEENPSAEARASSLSQRLERESPPDPDPPPVTIQHQALTTVTIRDGMKGGQTMDYQYCLDGAGPFVIQIPDGKVPGDQFQFVCPADGTMKIDLAQVAPDGQPGQSFDTHDPWNQPVRVTIPEGVTPGGQFTIKVKAPPPIKQPVICDSVCRPGTGLDVTTPWGGTAKVTIPQDSQPGQAFTVDFQAPPKNGEKPEGESEHCKHIHVRGCGSRPNGDLWISRTDNNYFLTRYMIHGLVFKGLLTALLAFSVLTFGMIMGFFAVDAQAFGMSLELRVIASCHTIMQSSVSHAILGSTLALTIGLGVTGGILTQTIASQTGLPWAQIQHQQESTDNFMIATGMADTCPTIEFRGRHNYPLVDLEAHSDQQASLAIHQWCEIMDRKIHEHKSIKNSTYNSRRDTGGGADEDYSLWNFSGVMPVPTVCEEVKFPHRTKFDPETQAWKRKEDWFTCYDVINMQDEEMAYQASKITFLLQYANDNMKMLDEQACSEALYTTSPVSTAMNALCKMKDYYFTIARKDENIKNGPPDLQAQLGAGMASSFEHREDLDPKAWEGRQRWGKSLLEIQNASMGNGFFRRRKASNKSAHRQQLEEIGIPEDKDKRGKTDFGVDDMLGDFAAPPPKEAPFAEPEVVPLAEGTAVPIVKPIPQPSDKAPGDPGPNWYYFISSMIPGLRRAEEGKAQALHNCLATAACQLLRKNLDEYQAGSPSLASKRFYKDTGRNTMKKDIIQRCLSHTSFFGPSHAYSCIPQRDR